jgi:ribosomal protein S6
VSQKQYEVLVITSQGKPQAAAPGATGTTAAASTAATPATGSIFSFEPVVTKLGGKILATNDLGKRVLGFEVAKSRAGFVTNYEFEVSPDKVSQARHALELSDDVVRFMMIAKPKPAKAPKPRKKKSKNFAGAKK